MRIRSVLVAAVVLAAACALSAPSGVDLHGHVILTACAGVEPANPPPGWQACDSRVVPDATVVIAPVHGSVITARTDRLGAYQVEVTPAMYLIAAYGGAPGALEFLAQPQWVVVEPGKPLIWDVHAVFNAV